MSKRFYPSLSARKNRGFTLLEMLLALGLMSLLMLALTQLMSQGAEVWNNSDRDIRAVENDKIALDFLRKMIQRAQPIDWKNGDENGQINKVFVGDANALSFAAPLPVAGSDALGIYFFTVTAQQTQEYPQPAMLVSYRPLDEESLEATLKNEAQTEVIMTEVEQVTFSYYGDKDSMDGTDSPEWNDSWRAATEFPQAVKMHTERSAFDADNPDSAERMTWDGVVFEIFQRSLR